MLGKSKTRKKKRRSLKLPVFIHTASRRRLCILFVFVCFGLKRYNILSISRRFGFVKNVCKRKYLNTILIGDICFLRTYRKREVRRLSPLSTVSICQWRSNCFFFERIGNKLESSK